MAIGFSTDRDDSLLTKKTALSEEKHRREKELTGRDVKQASAVRANALHAYLNFM